MKKIFAILALVAVFASCQKDEVVTEDLDLKKALLVGQHFNLNIIGVSKEKSAEMTGSNGNVIFVPLWGTSRIYLEEGDYAVLDANGTDGEARFSLPNPGYDPYVIPSPTTVTSSYSIWVRPLGKPGGYSEITTCAELIAEEALFGMLSKGTQKVLNGIDDLTGAYCSVEQVGSDITMRTKGKTTWTDVTAQLTSIVFKVEIWFDANGDGLVDDGEVTISYVRVPIFDDMLANEYWKYDNSGLKLLQVRFYPFGSTISEMDDPNKWN